MFKTREISETPSEPSHTMHATLEPTPRALAPSVRAARAIRRRLAPATYIGTLPGFRNLPAIELYNLTAQVGEHPPGSTVSRRTLEQHGYAPPPASGSRSQSRPALRRRVPALVELAVAG